MVIFLPRRTWRRSKSLSLVAASTIGLRQFPRCDVKVLMMLARVSSELDKNPLTALRHSRDSQVYLSRNASLKYFLIGWPVPPAELWRNTSPMVTGRWGIVLRSASESFGAQDGGSTSTSLNLISSGLTPSSSFSNRTL